MRSDLTSYLLHDAVLERPSHAPLPVSFEALIDRQWPSFVLRRLLFVKNVFLQVQEQERVFLDDSIGIDVVLGGARSIAVYIVA